MQAEHPLMGCRKTQDCLAIETEAFYCILSLYRCSLEEVFPRRTSLLIYYSEKMKLKQNVCFQP